MYRATWADRQWRPVATPKGMSARGRFAKAPPALGQIYFYAPPPWPAKEEALNELRSNPQGLYVCGAKETEWRLVTDEYEFKDVLAAGGNLYAHVARRKGEPWKDAVLRSTDGGKSWDDITHRALNLGMGGIDGLMPDPDHPDLVCLSCHGIRGYVLQATDENFEWSGQVEWKWHERHAQDEAGFFAPLYAFTGIDSISDYLFPATFGNYFDYPFGDRTDIAPFELALDREEYTFAAADPKPVKVTLRFRRNDHTAGIMDLAGAGDFFGLRIMTPDGERVVVEPRADHQAERDEKATQGAYEKKPGYLTRQLTDKSPYARTLNLETLHGFQKPGTYKVQLTYACPWWVGQGRGHWTGSFNGRMVTVTVK